MKKLLLTCFALGIALCSFAQERMVTGKVTSAEDGNPLPGVNVILKGTTSGTSTDANGNFTIGVPPDGGSLNFSFIGLESKEVEIGQRTVIDVSLALDIAQLSEVVITGQGIAREKKALGYAVAGVSSDAIAARPVQDIGRILMGKIAGVTINPTGGTSGTGSQINIRGYSTITGNTQPLWVVDGVPFNSATNDQSGFTTGGTATATSRFLDLDPNSIESINVLKGLAATVLYGDQGRNGVILVTTKAGTKKKRTAEVSFQQTIARNEIASLPDFQHDYGNGFQQLTNTSQFFSNWGANYDEIDSIGHPYQFLGDLSRRDPFLSQTAFTRIPYEHSMNVEDFFRKGITSNTSLSVSGGSDKMGVTATLGYTTEQGFAPGNDLKRLNASVGFNASLTQKLSITSNVMVSNSDFATPPLNASSGSGSQLVTGVSPPSLYGQFLYSPGNYNLNDISLFPYETPGEQKMVWYRSGSDIPNPRWLAAHVRATDVTDRIFNSTTLNYDFNDRFSISYRVGFDYYTQRQNFEFNKGASPTFQPIDLGVFQTQTISNRIWNHDIISAYATKLTDNINLSARIGLNARNDLFLRDGLYSEQQIVFGLMQHSNFQTSSSRSPAFGNRVFYRREESQRYGAYADFQFDFKDFVFLNLAGRKDWVSFLEQGNNSLFYPSASASVVLTDALDIKSNLLNFFKLRLGYGTSAGYPDPYRTRTVINSNARGFVDVGGAAYAEHTISNQLGNPNLTGELIGELEAGFETKVLNERLSLDFAVYNRKTKDLITDAPIDPSTGYTTTLLNLGEVSNKGIEIGLNATPLKLPNGLQWDVIWNFTAVRPEVVKLGTGIDEIVLAGFTNLGNFAVPNRPMNIIKGQAIARDPDGNPIVGSDGLHELDPLIKELGNPNPDFLTTLINTISFKGISLSVQVDYRKGGMMYGSTPSALLARGVLASEDVMNRDLAFIAPGVKRIDTNQDGTLDGFAPNDITLTAADYGFNLQFSGRNDNAMYDASNIRIREVSLGYQLPKTILSKTPFKTASITLNGNNVWYFAFGVPKYTRWDPEVASLGVNQGLGFDFLTGPSMRKYGASLRLTF